MLHFKIFFTFSFFLFFQLSIISLFAQSKLGGRTECFPLLQIINLPISSGKMWALRPVHATQFFLSIKNSSGKMRALRPVYAAQFFMYFSHFFP